MSASRSNLSLASKALAMNLISPLVNGVSDRSEVFSESDRALILDRRLASCTGLYGVEDGTIFAAVPAASIRQR